MGVNVSIGTDCCEQRSSDLKSYKMGMPWLFASKVIGSCFSMCGAAACVLWRFRTPHRGSLLPAFIACTLYVPVQIFMGCACFGLCMSPLYSLHIHMCLASALLILSGFSWPCYAMSQAVNAVAHRIPLFPLNCIMRKRHLTGTSSGSQLSHFFPS